METYVIIFAAGSSIPEEQGVNFFNQAKRDGYIFNPCEVSEIDLKQKRIKLKIYINKDGIEILPERQVDFDYLIVAMGSKTNDFNTKGVKE